MPTRWTRAGALEVADALDHAAADPGIARLAAEWERLDAAARICRGTT